MRAVSILIAAAALLGASPAISCATYGPSIEREQHRAQKRFLEYADIIVKGTWKEQEIDRENGGVSGVIQLDGKSEKDWMPLTFSPEINCGFPAFPGDGERGSFYLRAESISPGDYLAEHIDYDLLHFERRGK